MEERVVNKVDGDVGGSVYQAGRDVNVRVGGAEVGFPYLFGRIPPRVRGFQRRAEAEVLAQALAKGGVPVVAQGGVAGMVAGLGGVGKTQLAADYARQVWDAKAVELLVWVTATSREAVVGAYHRLAEEVTGKDISDAEVGARRGLEWLAQFDRPWLVVLDDVQVAADLNGLWPPSKESGRVLLTTRRRDAALVRKARMVSVGLFTAAESSAYLREVVAEHLREGAEGLAEAVGHLPLALSQAAAYLTDRGLTCAEYTRRFSDRKRALADLLPDPGDLPDEHRATVATTWSLSVEAADQLSPRGMARPLLETTALLDPNGIPSILFDVPVLSSHLGHELGRVVDQEVIRDGLACLHRFHLITLDPGTPHLAVRVHALVQRATRDTTAAGRWEVLVRALNAGFRQAWHESGDDTALADALNANTAALRAALADRGWTPDRPEVAKRPG